MSERSTPKEVLAARARLSELLERNGCVREPDLAHRKKVGCRSYKKGWEVRLTLKTRAELAEARRLLRLVGFSPGRPFDKADQVIQPVYGRLAVEQFLSWGKEA